MPSLDLKLEFSELRELYKNTPATSKLHALIIGETGSGKTSLLKTCPKPVLVHSFDPGGTQVLKEEIANGSIIVDTRYEADTMQSPQAIKLWEKEFNRFKAGGLFDNIATYCIDSLSTMSDAVLWQIMAKEGRVPPGITGGKFIQTQDDKGKGMRMQDWSTVLNFYLLLVKSLTSLPCHTILFGHINKERDEMMGNTICSLLVPGQAREKIPIGMSEVYILTDKHKLLTRNNGLYRATTRIGSGVFEEYEEGNIRKLLKKAGLDYEDKEPV